MVQDPFDNEKEPDLGAVLDTLRDPDCRTIIKALENPMTATELSEHCDIPLSTMYRKLERLTDATLLDERLEIRADGRHTSRYLPNFETVTVKLDDEHSLQWSVARPPQTVDERLENLWSEVRRGVK